MENLGCILNPLGSPVENYIKIESIEWSELFCKITTVNILCLILVPIILTSYSWVMHGALDSFIANNYWSPHVFDVQTW